VSTATSAAAAHAGRWVQGSPALPDGMSRNNLAGQATPRPMMKPFLAATSAYVLNLSGLLSKTPYSRPRPGLRVWPAGQRAGRRFFNLYESIAGGHHERRAAAGGIGAAGLHTAVGGDRGVAVVADPDVVVFQAQRLRHKVAVRRVGARAYAADTGVDVAGAVLAEGDDGAAAGRVAAVAVQVAGNGDAVFPAVSQVLAPGACFLEA